MATIIHPTAVVHPTAVIYDEVWIGENVYIGPFCVIGAPAEKRGSTSSFGVSIHAGTRLEKAVVVDSGSQKTTSIGPNCMLMSGVYVGHDCLIGQCVTISPKAVIGGHVVVFSDANIGMNAGIHQYQVIGKGAMIGANSFVTRLLSADSSTYVWPYMTYVGVPAKVIGRNKRYSDIGAEDLHRANLQYIDYVTCTSEKV